MTQARRNFTLELPLYSPSEMAEHQAGHPRCTFCKQHYYSSDELFTHMRARHFGCQVCQRASGDFNYFENADSLIDHLRCATVQSPQHTQVKQEACDVIHCFMHVQGLTA